MNESPPPVDPGQMSLFDLGPAPTPTPVVEAGPTLSPALDDLAFLYTATDHGNNSGIRFMLTLTEARTWCTDPSSRGVGRGAEWAFFYTTVTNFIDCHWGTHTPSIDLRRCTDDGRCDQDLERLGLHKIPLRDIPSVLRPLGVEVLS